ncbi:MAG TPA: YhjD/YihY/BrkB family envelope integrity protein [Gaiellaceae bacterium]|nr:YhjD/YihY/BrkB family envelope integrity protein [Gaiellaceae bacterium]
MEPVEREPAEEVVGPASRRERTRLWAAAIRANGEQLAQRAQRERGRHRSVDAVFEMVDRDSEVGGGIIAGALAYRLFIWLLPLALVAVAGLGFAADAASTSPEEAADSLGIEGLVSSSITNAAESPNRWYALLIGIPVLLWTTRSLLRVLIGAHRLVWSDVRAAAPKPTPIATLRLLVLLLTFGAVTTFASALRAWSPGPGLIATLATVVAYAGLWLLISLQLPHRGAGWVALVPGALVYGVGVEVLNVVVVYVITPWALAKQGTYGALGIAAALLFGLYLISRVVVAAAVVNVTLWERQARPE